MCSVSRSTAIAKRYILGSNTVISRGSRIAKTNVYGAKDSMSVVGKKWRVAIRIALLLQYAVEVRLVERQVRIGTVYVLCASRSLDLTQSRSWKNVVYIIAGMRWIKIG